MGKFPHPMRTHLIAAVLFSCLAIHPTHADTAEKPLFKDFIGINGHFQFKPDLYKQTCRLVRNYHNINWDVKKPGDPITFPHCPNKVDWDKHVYGKWVDAGFEVDLCAQFGSFGEANEDYLKLWEGQEKWFHQYGYYSCTPEAMKKRQGWAKKLNWKGVTDKQQAQYLIRSLFCFSERDIQRAYIYYFNDSDEASVHASSGLTRNFQPKPSFWAVKHLYETLGDYRMNRVVHQESGHLYAYEFTHASDKQLVAWVVWSPTGNDREQQVTLQNIPGRPVKAEQMPLQNNSSNKIDYQVPDARSITLTISESPIYLMFEKH